MKKILKGSLVVLLLGVFLTIPVMAKGHNGFHAGDSLTLEKKIASTLFAAGNNVEVSSNVDGASFIAGNNLTISSTQDILFAAGNSLNLNDVITKDAFIAGSKIEINESSIRDLYAAADSIRIDSNIDRNLYLGGNKITINGYIGGDCYIDAEEIRIGKDANIVGTLKYPEESKISISDEAVINEKEIYKGKKVNIEIGLKEMIISHVISFLTLLVTGLILLAILMKLFKKMEKIDLDFSNGVKHFFTGFLLIIGVPIVCIALMISFVGIPFSLITLVIFAISIYLSSIATSYCIGSHIFKDKIKNRYLLLTISLLILYLLQLIPIIGGFISFISLCMGLSIYLEVFKKSIK